MSGYPKDYPPHFAGTSSEAQRKAIYAIAWNARGWNAYATDAAVQRFHSARERVADLSKIEASQFLDALKDGTLR